MSRFEIIAILRKQLFSKYFLPTVTSKSIHSVGSGFSSISPSNLGQISKSGTVLKSWECVDFKTAPDFEIWPRFDGEIEEKPDPTEWIDFEVTVAQLGEFDLSFDFLPKLNNPLQESLISNSLETALIYWGQRQHWW